MADIEFNFGELDALQARIESAPRKASTNLRKAIEVSARYVRDGWRKPLQGSATLPLGAMSVTYDIEGGEGVRQGEIRAEIGPELERGQGPLIGMLEFGTSSIGPRGYGLAALKAVEEDFVRGVAIAAGDVLDG